MTDPFDLQRFLDAALFHLASPGRAPVALAAFVNLSNGSLLEQLY
jgi:hypothetical protein